MRKYLRVQEAQVCTAKPSKPKLVQLLIGPILVGQYNNLVTYNGLALN